MKPVDVEAARKQFMSLLEKVERGQEVAISREGKLVARLVPHRSTSRPPVFGADRGRLVLPDDFDAPLGP